MPNPLGLVLGFLFRQCTNPSILETVTKIVNDTQCAASCVALCNVCDWTSKRGAPSSKRQISIACLLFSLHKKGITIIVTFLLVEFLLGGGLGCGFGLGSFWHIFFILRKTKLGENSLRRSKRSFRLSMGMKWVLPGGHLAKSHILVITEQFIAFQKNR